MRQAEFTNLRSGDKIHKRSRPNETLTVVLQNGRSVVAVHGEETLEATRLINPLNWGFANRPGCPLTDEEFSQLQVGDQVRYPYDRNRKTFTVVLVDERLGPVAVKGTEVVEVIRVRNPGNVMLVPAEPIDS